METLIQQFKRIKQSLIDAILAKASETDEKILIFHDLSEIDYESCDNGWLNGPLGAISADGDAYFVEEGSEYDEYYDFEADYACIVEAYMGINDIMLPGLITIAQTHGLCSETVAEANKFIEDIQSRIDNLPEKPFSIDTVYANIDNGSGWWSNQIVKVSSKEVSDTDGDTYEWSECPLDDQCRLLDAYIIKYCSRKTTRTYYQPIVKSTNDVPSNMYSFQAFASVKDCKEWMSNFTSFVEDDYEISEYHDDDIEDVMIIDDNGNPVTCWMTSEYSVRLNTLRRDLINEIKQKVQDRKTGLSIPVVGIDTEGGYHTVIEQIEIRDENIILYDEDHDFDISLISTDSLMAILEEITEG